MEPIVVTLPEFQVIGFSFSANLTEITDQQLGKKAFDELLSRASEVTDKAGDDVYLIQIYPNKPDFNPTVDAFTQMIGYKVSNVANVPSGMTTHAVPANDYVTTTHRGLESELGRTYDHLYGQWLPQSGRRFGGYDFERWDYRYHPDHSENEIDVYVAIK